MPYKSTALLLVALWGSNLPSLSALPNSVPVSLDIADAAAAPALGQKSEAITEKNWQQQPKIVAIRKIVSAVDAGLKRGAFKMSVREFDDCWNGDTSRRIAHDAKGVVRYYETYGYGEEHDTREKRYYDAFGRLRFVYIVDRWRGTGTARIYFDENGKRVWENAKFVKGALGVFGALGPFDDEYFQKNPSDDFKSASDCSEIQRKVKHRSR